MSNPSLDEVRSGADLTTVLSVDDKTYKVRRIASIRDRIALGTRLAQVRSGIAPESLDRLTLMLSSVATTLEMAVLEPKDFDPFAAEVDDEHLMNLWKEYEKWEGRFRAADGGSEDGSGGAEGRVPGDGGA